MSASPRPNLHFLLIAADRNFVHLQPHTHTHTHTKTLLSTDQNPRHKYPEQTNNNHLAHTDYYCSII